MTGERENERTSDAPKENKPKEQRLFYFCMGTHAGVIAAIISELEQTINARSLDWQLFISQTIMAGIVTLDWLFVWNTNAKQAVEHAAGSKEKQLGLKSLMYVASLTSAILYWFAFRLLSNSSLPYETASKRIVSYLLSVAIIYLSVQILLFIRVTYLEATKPNETPQNNLPTWATIVLIILFFMLLAFYLDDSQTWDQNTPLTNINLAISAVLFAYLLVVIPLELTTRPSATLWGVLIVATLMATIWMITFVIAPVTAVTQPDENCHESIPTTRHSCSTPRISSA